MLPEAPLSVPLLVPALNPVMLRVPTDMLYLSGPFVLVKGRLKLEAPRQPVVLVGVTVGTGATVTATVPKGALEQVISATAVIVYVAAEAGATEIKYGLLVIFVTVVLVPPSV
jgi:hypothetical protein